ncbi:hypothetical protein DPMN_066942 [Dreissena polymorpha]|uniref:Uncharacterized protein n=1 Tax=Dreissena polymorpha TaxID=45954 RepID=A0A9D3YUY9_DREPO|nr:hypothetical protein DPMN_066942 [Dreissena polymorpha]
MAYRPGVKFIESQNVHRVRPFRSTGKLENTNASGVVNKGARDVIIVRFRFDGNEKRPAVREG